MPTSSPEIPDPAPLPVEEPTPPLSSGPTCGACGGMAVVNWRRRPTDDELAEVVAAEQSRRDQILLLADPQLPEPAFPPLPTGDDMTRTLYACAAHAIALDEAARIHASNCTAPNEAGMGGCDCTPEPLPGPEVRRVVEPAESLLPSHWTSGGA